MKVPRLGLRYGHTSSLCAFFLLGAIDAFGAVRIGSPFILKRQWQVEQHMPELDMVLKGLIEIGAVLNVETDPKHSHEVNRLRQLILDAQDLVLHMERQALESPR